MTEQDCSPVGQRAKGKIPNNPLLKGTTLPSSCARGEISNTRTFWGGQVKTITASSSQLSSDTRAPECPLRTSVIQPNSASCSTTADSFLYFLYFGIQVRVWIFRKPGGTSVAAQTAHPPDCPAGAHPVTLPTSNSSLNTCHQFHSHLNQ